MNDDKNIVSKGTAIVVLTSAVLLVVLLVGGGAYLAFSSLNISPTTQHVTGSDMDNSDVFTINPAGRSYNDGDSSQQTVPASVEISPSQSSGISINPRLFSFLGMTPQEVENVLGVHTSNIWGAGYFHTFGDYTVGFDGGREEPYGTLSFIWTSLSDIVNSIPTGGVNVSELSSLFGGAVDYVVDPYYFGGDWFAGGSVLYNYQGVMVAIAIDHVDMTTDGGALAIIGWWGGHTRLVEVYTSETLQPLMPIHEPVLTPAPDSPFVGRWRNNLLTLEFLQDGIALINSEHNSAVISWNTENGRLNLSSVMNEELGRFTFETDNDFNEILFFPYTVRFGIRFTRVSGNPGEIYGTWYGSRGQISFNNDGSGVWRGAYTNWMGQRQLQDPDHFTWSNGYFLILTHPILDSLDYSISNSELTIFFNQNSGRLALHGDRLFDFGRMTFTRLGSN